MFDLRSLVVVLVGVGLSSSFETHVYPHQRYHVRQDVLALHAVIETSPFASSRRRRRGGGGGGRGLGDLNNNDNSDNDDDVADNAYIRWKKEDDTWNMQTAVTTFQRGNETLELHAQVHFADKSYFEYYNSPTFNDKFQTVHYELLVDDELLQYEHGRWRVKDPIMASPNDQNLAKNYGWECQASQIDYTNCKWVHADLSRQEFIRLTQQDAASNGNNDNNYGNAPLWSLVSNTQSSSTAAEAVSALLVGPPQLSYSNPQLKRRLFTNLFLPGNSLANTLRAVLWLTVPSPELSIILLDWSSLLNGGGSGGSGTKKSPGATFSDMALPILSSLVKFDIQQIRRLIFGQVLISSKMPPKNKKKKNGGSADDDNDDNSGWSVLVTKRNDRALDVVRQTLSTVEEQSSSSSSSSDYSTALLYGSSHCPDLHDKLIAMGFQPVATGSSNSNNSNKKSKKTWRTAWSVKEQQQETALPALGGFLLFYLIIGALDWVSFLGDFSQSWEDGSNADAGLAAAGLYLLRHVLLYLGLSKFLVDWSKGE